jgi:hypothetical protein
LETKIKIIELTKVYRQKDDSFINLLNKIRINDISYAEIATLNKRYIEDFKPKKDNFYINLTTTNSKADEINNNHLSKLKGELYKANAIIDGEFGKESYPTLQALEYKIESQIMMLKNDHRGRWVNGSLGVIKGKNKAEDGSDFLSIWFPDKKINVDHKIPAGSLRSGADLEGFIERLFVEVEGLQVLCINCHDKKTAKERENKS